jgi:xylose isomerase
MRTYLILKQKARAFAAHAGIQSLLAEIRGAGGELGAYSRPSAEALKAEAFDRHALASRRLAYERLDQLVIDLLLGVA